MYAVQFTEPAENDLSDAVEYISNVLKAPQAAERLVNVVEKELQLLETLPLSFPLVRDDYLAAQGIRLLVVSNYLLFYTVNEAEKSVTVIRFLSGRRDWTALLGS